VALNAPGLCDPCGLVLDKGPFPGVVGYLACWLFPPTASVFHQLRQCPNPLVGIQPHVPEMTHFPRSFRYMDLRIQEDLDADDFYKDCTNGRQLRDTAWPGAHYIPPGSVPRPLEPDLATRKRCEW
jgi:hypothetical protein